MTHPEQQHGVAQPQNPMAGLAAWFTEMGKGLAQLAQETGRLSGQQQEEVGRLRQELAEMAKEQDARLGDLLAKHNQLRQDVSGAHVHHQDLSRNFKDLVQLELLPACARFADLVPSTSETDVQLRRMKVTRRVCRLLFGALPAHTDDLRALLNKYTENTAADPEVAALHRPLLDKVNRLRAEIAALGTPFRWDFEAVPGTPYQHDRYQLWQTASPQAPIRYVVVPAYTVPGMAPYVQATVFTDLLEQFGPHVQPS